MYNLKFPPGGGVLYRPTQHAPEEEGEGGEQTAVVLGAILRFSALFRERTTGFSESD